MTLKVRNITLAVLSALIAFVVAFSVITVRKSAFAAEADCSQTGIHIEGFDNTTDSKIWSVHTDPAHTVTTNADQIKQGDGAFYTKGQGIADGSWQLAATVDISGVDCVTFWLYLENAQSFNNMADGQLVLSDRADVDNGKIRWSLKGNGFVDGWNYVMFKISDATKEGSAGVDLTKIAYCRIYFVGLGEICTAVFDDLHANYSEGIQIAGFNSTDTAISGGSITSDANYIKEGDGAFYTKGGGIAPGAYKLKNTIDISKCDAVAFWLYLENADSFNKMGDGQLVLSDLVLQNDGDSIDSEKIYWSLKGNGFTDGWNYVVFKLSDATKEGAAVDLSKISSFRIYFVSLPIDGADPDTHVTAVFDDIRAIETQFLAEEMEPIESYTITDADSIISGVFDGMSQAYSEHKQGISCLTGSVSAESNALTAKFGALASGLSKTAGENELGLSMWLYVDDAAKAGTVTAAISSGNTVGSFELKWTISGLNNGWNWVALKASDAAESNVVDMNALQRLTLSFAATDAVTVKLDRVRIYNTTKVTGWDAQPDESEAVVMNPVDEVRVSNLDAVTSTVFNGAKVETQNHKEGVGAAILSGNGAKTISALSIGTTDLLATDVTPVNEFGITLWLYIPEDCAYQSFNVSTGSSIFGDGGYESAGRITFEIPVSELAAGWNWLVLRASQASAVSADFNPNAIGWFLVKANGDGEESYMVDRISVVNATVASAVAQPSDDEKQTRNPVSGKIIINCDTSDGITFSGNPVDTSDMREGKGSIKTEGAGFQLEAKYLEIGKTDLTKETLVLCMWIYIEAPDVFAASGVNGQIELTSSNGYDQQEINWSIGKNGAIDFSELSAGWNWVVLKGENGSVTGGSPDYDALNYFRLYLNGCAYTVFKMDRVTLTNIYDEESYAEPDWESEIFGGGGDENFQGSNSKYADSVYLETEIEGDPFDTTVTVTKDGGCNSSIAYSALIAAAVAVCGATVLLILAERKSRKED